MQPISIEETWKTPFWEQCPYFFFLGVTTANAQYGHEYFGKNEHESILLFRRMLSKEMIYNRWVPKDLGKGFGDALRSKRRKVEVCELLNLPPRIFFWYEYCTFQLKLQSMEMRMRKI